MTDWVVRKFATDVDEPVLAEPRKGFFVRFMEALGERDAVKLTARLQNTLTFIKQFWPGPDYGFRFLPAAYDAKSRFDA